MFLAIFPHNVSFNIDPTFSFVPTIPFRKLYGVLICGIRVAVNRYLPALLRIEYREWGTSSGDFVYIGNWPGVLK